MKTNPSKMPARVARPLRSLSLALAGMVRSVLPVLAALLVAGGADAAQTDWVKTPGGRVRLVASAPQPDGTVEAAVVIDLDPGWKTYWRNPGDSGIPPRFATEGSTNIASAELAFPAPRLLREGGLAVNGYDRPVALPLTLRQRRPGAATTLKADLFIGICKDICIPVKGDFTLTLPPAVSGGESVAETMPVRRAFAALPELPGADFRVESLALGDDARALKVAVRLPDGVAGKEAELFAAAPGAWVIGVARRDAVDGRTARFTVPVTSAREQGSLRGLSLHLVVRAGDRSMAVTRRVP